MPYIQVKDFKQGMVRNRKRVASDPGSLWLLENGHITRGGDVEGNRRFVPQFSLPNGTFGMAQTKGQIYVFGESDLAGSMPVGVQYLRMAASDIAMVKLLDAKNNDGKFFTIAEYDDGNIRAYYDGTQITSLDTLADANCTYVSLAEYLATKISARTDVISKVAGQSIVVTAKVAGTPFSYAAAHTNNGANPDETITAVTQQANVAATAEVRATATLNITGGSPNPGVNQITALTLDGVPLISAPIDFITDAATTAAALVYAINMLGATSFFASSSGPILTLTAAAGSGASANGKVLAVTTSGTVAATPTNSAGGVSAVAAKAQVVQFTLGGTFEPLDLFTITINGDTYKATGRASGHVTFAFVYKKRIYAVAGSLLRYSAISAPTDWTTVAASSGASFINMNSDSEGSERLVAVEQYQTYVGIWSRRLIRLYALNTDATTNTFVQTLQQTGSDAPKSVLAFGNTDVFYRDQTGIRSVKARDASNAAFVSDVGTKIDAFVREYVNTLSNDVVQRATAIVDPVDGRFWLAMGSRIWVLSYYPSEKIQAWSYYAMGSQVDAMCVALNDIYVRQGNTISLYGGVSGTELPGAGEQVLTVQTPFLAGDKPATQKMIPGWDQAAVGAWDVYALPDANDETRQVHIGIPEGVSYGDQNIGVQARGSVIAINMTCATAGARSMSSFALHFAEDEAR